MSLDAPLESTRHAPPWVEWDEPGGEATIPAGTEVRELVTTAGKVFVQVRHEGEAPSTGDLPPGWNARAHVLHEDLEVDRHQGRTRLVRDAQGNLYARLFRFDGIPGAKRIFELVDWVRLLRTGQTEVWVTHLEPERARRLRRRASLRWFANTRYYRAWPTRHTFASSPDEAEGVFVERELYGERFVRNARVLHRPRLCGGGLLHRFTIRKLNELTFVAGTRLPVVRDPDGHAYLQFDVPFFYRNRIPRSPLPRRWGYEEYRLEADYHVRLFGDVTRLISNLTWVGFQGPIDPARIPGTCG